MSDPRPFDPLFDSTPLDLVTALRPNVAQMTAEAEAAVLTPRDPGRWPAGWRQLVAARIRQLNGLSADAPQGTESPSAAIDAAGRAFAEKVAAEPQAVTAADLDALRAAGVSDADIVRLCELVAFVSYRCRVEIGHALLAAHPGDAA